MLEVLVKLRRHISADVYFYFLYIFSKGWLLVKWQIQAIFLYQNDLSWVQTCCSQIADSSSLSQACILDPIQIIHANSSARTCHSKTGNEAFWTQLYN